MDLTKFDFQAKVFLIPGAFLYRAPADGKVMLQVDLGDTRASLDVEGIKREFGIKDDSQDARLIALCGRALNYVRTISPGDAIPTEIIDGSASWPIEQEHVDRARNTLMIRLAAWVSGNQIDQLDYAVMASQLQEPETQAMIQQGFTQAAVALGLPKAEKEKVVSLLEQLARELAYVEALRSYYQWIRRLDAQVRQSMATLRGSADIVASAVRVQHLLAPPLKRYRITFDNVDGQTAEIVSALKNINRVTEFVRNARDELHAGTLLWSTIRSDVEPLDFTNRRDAAKGIHILYRFLAQNFLETDGWIAA